MASPLKISAQALPQAPSFPSRIQLTRLLTHLGLSLGALSMALPFYWMVSSSLKESDAIFLFPPQWLPSPAEWGHYVQVVQQYPVALAYSNSLLIALPRMAGTLFTASLAAYAFARIRFSGRDVCFAVLLATMMVPYQVTVIPSYVLFKWIGWLDTPLPLIVPAVMTNAFGVFLIRQFLYTIPMELDAAAEIDGADTFQIYSQIILPLTQPVLATLGILTFLWSWNDFLGSLIFLTSPRWITVPLMVASTISGVANSIYWWEMLTVSTLAIVPVLVVFILGQRYFTEGIALSGLKGG